MAKGQIAMIGIFILLVIFFLVCAVSYGISYTITNSASFLLLNESSQEAFTKLDNNYKSLDYFGIIFVIVYIILNIVFSFASKEHPLIFLINIVFFIAGIIGFGFLTEFITSLETGSGLLTIAVNAFPITLNIVKFWPLISTASFFLSIAFRFIGGDGY